MRPPRDKLGTGVPTFWILQLVGWSGYALDRYLSSKSYFPVTFLYTVIACGISFGLRPVYKRLWARSPSLVAVGLITLFCSVLAGFLWLVLGQFIFWLLGINPYPDEPWTVYLRKTFVGTLVHHKPFLFLSWSALYFGIKYWRGGQLQEQHALRQSALAHEAELKMLRYQLNPHFLFNSLNSASALIGEDPVRAERMLNELSDFLRYTLLHDKVPDVPLRVELEAVRNYLAVEKIRFEDKLEVSFDVEPATENLRVPSFLIHPLVENAVKHGMQTSALPLGIDVKAHREDGWLQIEVGNTGRLLPGRGAGRAPGPKGTGTGVENVRQRLEQAFPGRHNFRLFESGGRVRAVLEIQQG